MKHFHEFIKDKRAEKGISLRQFCREAELDPSNWSKIERGILEAPKSMEALVRIGEALKLSTEEFQTLRDLAVIESIPADLKLEENVLEKLPIFFRTVRGDKPSQEELKKLISTLSQS
jgi:transcriptional regulator with XRE-family HTH domain